MKYNYICRFCGKEVNHNNEKYAHSNFSDLCLNCAKWIVNRSKDGGNSNFGRSYGGDGFRGYFGNVGGYD